MASSPFWPMLDCPWLRRRQLPMSSASSLRMTCRVSLYSLVLYIVVG